MKYCKKCDLSVAGVRKLCPLCKNELVGENNLEEERFPEKTKPKVSISLLIKLICFVSIATIVVSVTINLLMPTEVFWAWFVCGGVVCAWISSYVAIMERKNIFQNITWQMYIISALAVIWDYSTGWHGWALEYVFPMCCVASMISMYIFSIIAKIPPSDFIIYIIISSFYGIIPILFVILDIINVFYPSAICICVSLVSVAALIIFEGRNMKNEIIRKFHL